MVQTRKTSVNAAAQGARGRPSPSRSPSKGQAPENAKFLSNGLSNSEHTQDGDNYASSAGHANTTAKKEKATVGGKGNKMHQKLNAPQVAKTRRNWTDIFARLFLLWFAIYAFAICPSDTHLDSPVCRGLSEYRRLIVEPYLMPPIHNALSHPSVAPVIQRITPVVSAAARTSAPIIKTAYREWDRRVVANWHQYALPYLQHRISPLVARIEIALKPYTRYITTFYNKNIEPHVQQARKNARRMRPRVLIAIAKAHDYYEASLPYLTRIGRELSRLPPLFVKFVLNPLNSARRQFVDPHVTRMVDKVVELSGAKGVSSVSQAGNIGLTSTSPEDSIPSLSASKPSTSFDDAGFVDAPILTSSAVSAHASPSSSTTTAAFVDASSSHPPLEPTSAAANPEYSSPASLTDAPDVPVADVAVPLDDSPPSPPHSSESTLGEFRNEITEQDTPPLSPLEEDIVSNAETPSVSIVPVHPADLEPSAETPGIPGSDAEQEHLHDSVSKAEETSGDPDLQEFFESFVLDEMEASSGGENTEQRPAMQMPIETEEEKAARLEERAKLTAEKRREIQGRHSDWEQKLEELIKAQRKALRKALVALRKEAAAELKTSSTVREEIELLHREAEKAVKGTEAYFAKLKTDETPMEDKNRMWERILAKVEEKFQVRVTDVETTVNDWYNDILQKEVNEVLAAALPVKDLGEEAQTNLGLDYAWLDDVTYLDWKRYHALLDYHTKFLDQAQSIQNGSHPSPPINPLADVLTDIQSEVNDLIVGFETRWRRIRREGARAFSATPESETGEPIGDGEEQPESAPGPADSEIPSGGQAPAAGGADDESAADILLSKSKEQVEQALRNAEAVNARREEL